MTLRRSGSWLAYVLAPTAFAVLATGVALPTEAGVAVTQVAQVTEAVKPAPAPIAPEVEVATPEPPPTAESPAEPVPPAPAPDPEPEPEPEPCADSLAGVAAAGLTLPAGVDYQCPSTRFAHQGAACWDEWPCPGTAFIAINMSRLQAATPEYLRYVVAHEICHIIDFRDRGWTTEPRADACAAGYGF